MSVHALKTSNDLRSKVSTGGAATVGSAIES